jgi:diguanylate cyclase (GGDEF)-like protein
MLFIILAVALTLTLLVYWNAKINLHSARATYHTENADETDLVINRVKQTFDRTYRAIRTVARLPGIESLDWETTQDSMNRDGSILDENTRLTIQEIYNALALDVAVSELYIVPINLDPDELDPTRTSPIHPLVTFDEFIVGQIADDSMETQQAPEIEEIEIFEYRLMRKQLDWMLENYPDSSTIVALNYPAITGPPVVTCDNSRYDPNKPNDEDRTGLLMSVPIFDRAGNLKGCATAVIINPVLADLLPSGDFAIINTEYPFSISKKKTAQWADSASIGHHNTPDPSLMYSETKTIQTADHASTWILWAGHPDSTFWNRSDVRATLQARNLGFIAVLTLSLGFYAATKLVLNAYARLAHVNQGLEQVISERTQSAVSMKNEAVSALGREKVAMAEQEKTLAMLEKIASTDRLTGLPNRIVFIERLEKIMNQVRWNDARFAVLFFDFDRFKVVNDSLGHDIGDALLCDIADIFRKELREEDTVARFGGDEFVVLLRDLNDWSDAKLKAQRLLEAFNEPHLLNGHLVISTASIGLVTNENHYKDSAEMIRDADAAMYQAKDTGRARVVVFDQEMHDYALDQISLESDLRTALKEQQFAVVYQPIIELNNAVIKGFEALIRWNHPKRGLINPVDFIPMAESSGLIIDIGKWVLRTAVWQIAQWNEKLEDHQRLSININVSKRQLYEPEFVEFVVFCKDEFAIRPNELHLEITESSIADDQDIVVPILEQLRKHDIIIAMDDFGTGVSSLSTLHTFPIDVLKIDQSFIRLLDGDRSLHAVVNSIASLAENLGIQTVAEGIESECIIGTLQSIGCTWGQGYYFSRPLKASDAHDFIFDNLNDSKDAA